MFSYTTMAFQLCVIIIGLTTIPQLVKGVGERCQLNDVQKTPGVCTDIQECKFAVEFLRAGVKPKVCSGRVVCCPTEKTLSAKKCDEYQEYLKIPLVFGDTGPLPITCLVDAPAGGFIAGGRDAKPFEYSHVVALGWGSDENNLKFHCTGTLISEDYILTAAHCIASHHGAPTFALTGDIALTADNEGDYRQVVRIEKSIMHPNYNPPLVYNDVALVKLSTPLSLSQYLLPACLAQPGDKSTNNSVEAVGFGLLGPGEPQTNILQAVNLTTFGTKECQTFYNTASDKQKRFPQGLAKSQICAGDKTDSGKDTCNGDSGGPLTINKDYRCVFHLIGVTSFGARVCGYGQPAIFTRVVSYNNWIESIVWADGAK